MPLQDHHQIVSVDDHLVEHPRVFTDRLPPSSGTRRRASSRTTRAARLALRRPGLPLHRSQCGRGQATRGVGPGPGALRGHDPGLLRPGRAGQGHGRRRRAGGVCFPSFPGFGGRVFLRAKDKELASRACRRGTTSTSTSGAATAPDRFVPLAILPVWDIDLRGRGQAGHREGRPGRLVPRQPGAAGPAVVPHRPLGPALGVCAETGVGVSLHFGSGCFVPGFSASCKR